MKRNVRAKHYQETIVQIHALLNLPEDGKFNPNFKMLGKKKKGKTVARQLSTSFCVL